jgi:hypothetical protein
MTQDDLTSYGLTAAVSPRQEVLCRPHSNAVGDSHGGRTADPLSIAPPTRTGTAGPGTAEETQRPGTSKGPRLDDGALADVKEPRGARSAFVGWDLGRNDHTDEVGCGRLAEP